MAPIPGNRSTRRLALSMLVVVGSVSVQRWARNRGVLFHHNWGARGAVGPHRPNQYLMGRSTRRVALSMLVVAISVSVQRWSRNRGVLFHHNWSAPGSCGSPSSGQYHMGIVRLAALRWYVGSGRKRIRAAVVEKSGSPISSQLGRPG